MDLDLTRTTDQPGSVQEPMAALEPGEEVDGFSHLNREFLTSCINNVLDAGSNVCLAPITMDYLNLCIKLLNVVTIPEGNVPVLVDKLAKRLQLISKDFDELAKRLKSPSGNGERGEGETTSSPGVLPTFTFQQSNSTTTFGLSSPSPLSFPIPVGQSDVSNSASLNDTEDMDEAQEKEAQAHEFTPVKEDKAIFSTRCKLFYKPEGKDTFAVRGLGELYIQKTDNSHRILIRADNSLGNILLNMKITSDIPVFLNLDKKQVVSYDPHENCPISFRVKTGEVAQNLFDHIEKWKLSSTS